MGDNKNRLDDLEFLHVNKKNVEIYF